MFTRQESPKLTKRTLRNDEYSVAARTSLRSPIGLDSFHKAGTLAVTAKHSNDSRLSHWLMTSAIALILVRQPSAKVFKFPATLAISTIDQLPKSHPIIRTYDKSLHRVARYTKGSPSAKFNRLTVSFVMPPLERLTQVLKAYLLTDRLAPVKSTFL